MAGQKSNGRVASQKPKGRLSQHCKLWWWEIVSALASALAICGIAGILVRFNGRTLPNWPYHITLNSLMSVLSTVAKVAMLVPIADGLGQLKWVWFHGVRNPLVDMELFDGASRGGPVGTLKLLWRLRVRQVQMG
jgi:hypothetical protein